MMVKRVIIEVLNELFITHYCEQGKLPFHSITRLSREDAFLIAGELSKDCKSERNRFGEDFIGYYPHRMRTEEWLYHSFLKSGGKPQNDHPLYFVLCESERLHQWFGNGDRIRTPLSIIASEYISFTYGDSMSVVDKIKERKLVRKEELIQDIMTSGLNIIEYMQKMKEKHGYIEVQIWNDECIKEYIRY